MNFSARRFLLAGMLVTVALLSGACAGASKVMPKERALALQQSAETYRKLVRWGDFAAASQYCRPRRGEPASFDPARYKHWKVSSYEVADAQLGQDHAEASFSAALAFYSTETGRAGVLRDVQRWWYDKATKRWYLESPLPDFAAAAGQAISR